MKCLLRKGVVDGINVHTKYNFKLFNLDGCTRSGIRVPLKVKLVESTITKYVK